MTYETPEERSDDAAESTAISYSSLRSSLSHRQSFLVTLLSLKINPCTLYNLPPSAILNRTVSVKWSEGWFNGKVDGYDVATGKFCVVYDKDGDRRTYKLHKKEFKFL